MSKAARKLVDDTVDMDMTPMIDIVFNLLIFFMIVTDLTQKELADLTLPLAYMASEDKDNDPDDRIILNVDKNGVVMYRGVAITLNELGSILHEAKQNYEWKMNQQNKSGLDDIGHGMKASKLFVLLRADRNTPWQHVQYLMTIMAEQKLYKMQFATKKFVDGKALKDEDPEHVKRMMGGRTAKEQQRLDEGGG